MPASIPRPSAEVVAEFLLALALPSRKRLGSMRRCRLEASELLGEKRSENKCL